MVEKEECIFCKISKGEILSEKILETDNFFTIKDINPKSEGHSLVISKKHFKNLLDMPSSVYGEFLECAKESAFKVLKENKAGGFNLVMNNFEVAGQVVEHTHIHILPRKEGDGLKLKLGEGVV